MIRSNCIFAHSPSVAPRQLPPVGSLFHAHPRGQFISGDVLCADTHQVLISRGICHAFAGICSFMHRAPKKGAKNAEKSGFLVDLHNKVRDISSFCTMDLRGFGRFV